MVFVLTPVGISENLMYSVIPGFVAFVALTISYVIIMISYFITRNKEQDISKLESFSEFMLPQNFAWASAIVILLLLISNIEQGTIDRWGVILLNMAIVLNYGLMIQGISLLDFWIKKKSGIEGFLRIIIYLVGGIFLSPFLILFSGLIFLGFTFIGFVDILFDFRKLQTS